MAEPWEVVIQAESWAVRTEEVVQVAAGRVKEETEAVDQVVVLMGAAMVVAERAAEATVEATVEAATAEAVRAEVRVEAVRAAAVRVAAMAAQRVVAAWVVAEARMLRSISVWLK